MSVKRCPKCGGTAYKTEPREKKVAHGAHGSMHAAAAGHPILAAVGWVLTAIAAGGGMDEYKCERCGHHC